MFFLCRILRKYDFLELDRQTKEKPLYREQNRRFAIFRCILYIHRQYQLKC